MSIFTPAQAAGIASGVYGARGDTALRASLLRIEGLFEVGGVREFSSTSGALGWTPMTEFGYITDAGLGGCRGEALIAFRGTDLTQDWVTDANLLWAIGPTGNMVHKGFNDTWRGCQQVIDSFFNGKRPSRIHCVGHSLGGALATLTADYLKSTHAGSDVQLYTFGSPRVGGMDFARTLTNRVGAANIHRVFHPADPVPMVPLFPFIHVPARQNGLAIACGSSERISFGAHSVEHSYVPLMANATWAGLGANGSQSLTNRQIATWLDRCRTGGGGIVQLGARSLEMIGIALEWLLRTAAETVLASVLASVGNGLTMLDQLVIMLQRGAQLSARVSMYVQGLIAAILRFLGRTAVAGASLTVTFIRWVFESLFSQMRHLARSAVRMPR